MVSLWVKGIFTVFEIISGIATFFITKQVLINTATRITQREIAEDPYDIVANFFLHSVQSISAGTQEFVAIYLLVHGLIKLWLIIGLLRRKLWYYPVAMAVFGIFIIYQIYWYVHAYSVWLLFITVIDIIVISLTWHEYRYLKNTRNN